jgi:hypothetical protein
METKPKIRLGSGKKRSASWMTSSICLTDAEAHAYEYNGKKYFNININVYDTPNQYGKDVAIYLNEYEKDAAVPKANAFDTAPVDNLPF